MTRHIATLGLPAVLVLVACSTDVDPSADPVGRVEAARIPGLADAVRRQSARDVLGAAPVAIASPALVYTGPPPTIEPEWTSGTRLRARLFDDGHGATLRESWIDSSFDEPCYFTTAADGVMRC